MTRRVAPSPPGIPGLEPIRQDLYDTKTLVAATPVGTLEFFRNPATTGPIDTNMQGNGQLPYPHQYHIFGVVLEMKPNRAETVADGISLAIAANKKKLRELAYFKLLIGSKDYLTLPLKRLPEGLGSAGFGQGASAVPTMILTNSIQDVQQYYDVTIRQGGKIKPLHIPAQQAFAAQVVFPDGAPVLRIDWDFRCYLVGILWREVQ